MSGRLSWKHDGHDWPNRDASEFVAASGITWHVQRLGSGPTLLLLHGTGASTHSWRDLAPILAERFTVIAPDLPGHGFTDAPARHRMSLPGMARQVAGLLRHLDLSPALAVGHSAGAAILARMSLDDLAAPRGLVGLNGAWLPLRGVPGHLFQPIAKLLTLTPVMPHLFAWQAADRRAVERLIRDTGSTIDAVGMGFYARLARSPSHVAGALDMMANWDLRGLRRDLARLEPPLLLVTGANDRTIHPSETGRVRALLPQAESASLARLGHLAHEEMPQPVAELIFGFAERLRVLAA